MKKRLDRMKIIVFTAILILPGIVWYSVGLLSPDAVERWDYDTGENRQKSQMPSFLEEGYIQKLEAYYNDHIPFRSVLISSEQKLMGSLEAVYSDYFMGALSNLLYGKSDDTSMDISNLLGNEEQRSEQGTENIQDTDEEKDEKEAEHQYREEIELEADCLNAGLIRYTCAECGDSYEETIPALGHDSEVLQIQEASYISYGYTEQQCKRCGLVYRDDFKGKIIDNSYLAPVVVGDGVLLGRFNWLFYTGNASISYYRGANLLDEEKMAEYLGLMQQLQEICDEKGIQLQFMIMPNKEQMYPEYMPTYEIEDTYKRVDRLVDYIRSNSDINIIYPMQELKEAELYWQTYYQYDTHWNEVGAYIGTQALYEALGMETTDLQDLSVEQVAAEVRGLIDMGGLDGFRYPADMDYIIEYRPEVTVSGTEGNIHLLYIYSSTSDCVNEQNFVMLGDSFRCSMINYLTRDFSNCVIAHRDYVDSLHESIRNADILVISAVERYDARMFPTVERLIEILSD